MSSKKALRRERVERQEAESRRRGRPGPVALFIIAVGVALVGTVAVAFFVGDRPEPPYPGAVWSEAHGHWH